VVLNPTLKRALLAVLALAGCLGAFAPRAFASPFQEVKPGDALYERVKALGHWGLLDAKDQAVLDHGDTVTRLQLAYYTEKAKARISKPILPTPTPGGAGAPSIAEPVKPSEPTIQAPDQTQALPDLEQPKMAPAPALELPAAVSNEVDDLLKALKEESVYLRSRLNLLNSDLASQEAQLAALKRAQSAAEDVGRNANKNSGAWSFNTNSKWKFEDVTLKSTAPSGPITGTAMAPQRYTKYSQEIYFGMWGDLGKGSLSTGFGGLIPGSNDSTPVSLYLGKPEFKMNLDGRLGEWAFQALDEGFKAESTMGDFTRGVASDIAKQYERPFDIKPFSDDKFDKNWDDYIRSLGFVETQSLIGGNAQSTSDRVFDGVLTDGGNIPHLGNTKIKLLAGRLLRPNWFEYAVKANHSWLKDRFSTTLAGMWVDDSGTQPAPGVASIDMRNYTAELSANLRPVPIALSLEGAKSHFFTGIDTMSPSGAAPLIGQAFQLQASSYPFNFYYQDIRPEYANFQSKVDLTGIDVTRYGLSTTDFDGTVDRYGEVGEANQLQSNREGWRANLGWNGRRDDWMKRDLPTFFDYFVLNMDVASRTERVAMMAPMTTNSNGTTTYTQVQVIEPWIMVAPYYADDEGAWGLDLNGGYGGYTSAKQVRLNEMNNILAVRNAEDTNQIGVDGVSGVWSGAYETMRYRFRQESERIPLIDPATNTALQQLKTYNYLAFTNKWQLNKFYGGAKPLYLGVYLADNKVSGRSQVTTQADIPNLFHQSVQDLTLMAGRVLPYTDFLAHWANENWTCDWSVPRIADHTVETGLGIDYNLPWGGGKFGFRYNHVVYTSQFVPANNNIVEQVYVMASFRF